MRGRADPAAQARVCILCLVVAVVVVAAAAAVVFVAVVGNYVDNLWCRYPCYCDRVGPAVCVQRP